MEWVCWEIVVHWFSKYLLSSCSMPVLFKVLGTHQWTKQTISALTELTFYCGGGRWGGERWDVLWRKTKQRTRSDQGEVLGAQEAKTLQSEGVSCTDIGGERGRHRRLQVNLRQEDSWWFWEMALVGWRVGRCLEPGKPEPTLKTAALTRGALGYWALTIMLGTILSFLHVSCHFMFTVFLRLLKVFSLIS